MIVGAVVSKAKGIDEMTREEIERLLQKLRDMLQLCSPTARRESDNLSLAVDTLAQLLQDSESISGDADEVADRIAEAIRTVRKFESNYSNEKTVH